LRTFRLELHLIAVRCCLKQHLETLDQGKSMDVLCLSK